MLADKMVELDYTESISHETVLQGIKKGIKPWRVNGWEISPVANSEEVKRILDRFEFIYTPKHGSKLNKAEVENIVLMG